MKELEAYIVVIVGTALLIAGIGLGSSLRKPAPCFTALEYGQAR